MVLPFFSFWYHFNQNAGYPLIPSTVKKPRRAFEPLFGASSMLNLRKLLPDDIVVRDVSGLFGLRIHEPAPDLTDFDYFQLITGHQAAAAGNADAAEALVRLDAAPPPDADPEKMAP